MSIVFLLKVGDKGLFRSLCLLGKTLKIVEEHPA